MRHPATGLRHECRLPHQPLLPGDAASLHVLAEEKRHVVEDMEVTAEPVDEEHRSRHLSKSLCQHEPKPRLCYRKLQSAQ